ncbi:MAG: tyrosine-protein phosphatase [Clostridia bacterium]|nr:tyrosine-protein phosphatase [Clostridia bacterium]
MKKIFSLILALLLCFAALTSCCKAGNPELKSSAVTHETKFGGVYFDKTIEEFNALGFEYGDSVNIAFSNGKTLEDIPYYNGYYVDIGEAVLVAYPGYPYIDAMINYGDDLYLALELDENCTADITLCERGKYWAVQKARDIQYSDEQGEQSDIVFANFRAVNMGDLKKDVLYRSASPCNDEHNRASVTDRLAAEAKIGFMLNLSDNESDILGFIAAETFDSPYFLSLFTSGKVAPLGLSANFKSESFGEKLAQGLEAVAQSEGPVLIHCVEGKDRTGYVLMLLEALCGATYGEIVDDYMLTYDNYYGINKTSDPERYDIIKEKNLDVMISYMTGTPAEDGFENVDLAKSARALLIKIGMTEDSVNRLYSRLTGK